MKVGITRLITVAVVVAAGSMLGWEPEAPPPRIGIVRGETSQVSNF